MEKIFKRKLTLLMLAFTLNFLSCSSKKSESNNDPKIEMTQLKEKIIINIKDATDQKKDASNIINLKLVRTYQTSDLIQAFENQKIFENIKPKELVSAKLK